MTVRFLTEAEEEFREAARYYEAEVPGLGFAFIAELNRSLARLGANPEIGSPSAARLRKLPLRRFPYKLIYSLEPDGILIVAVAHSKRRPFYWRKRLKSSG